MVLTLLSVHSIKFEVFSTNLPYHWNVFYLDPKMRTKVVNQKLRLCLKTRGASVEVIFKATLRKSKFVTALTFLIDAFMNVLVLSHDNLNCCCIIRLFCYGNRTIKTAWSAYLTH